MRDILKAIDYYLIKNEELKNLLSAYQGEPAIALRFAPSDMKTPYAVLNASSNVPEDNEIHDRMILTVDIFTDNAEIITAAAIGDVIEVLMDDELIHPSLGLIIKKDSGPKIIPDEDISTIHLHLSFVVRYNNAKTRRKEVE